MLYLSEIQFGEDQKPKSTVEILRTGQWNGNKGRFAITKKNLDGFVKNFNENVYGSDLQVNLGHNRQGEAAGWFQSVRREGNRLLAEIEWTDLGQEKLTSKRYKYFSSELDFFHKDDETGRRTPNVLMGGALTNVPYVKGMKQATLFSEELEPQFLSNNITHMDAFKTLCETLLSADSISKSELATANKMYQKLSEDEKAEAKEDMEKVEEKAEEEKDEGGDASEKDKDAGAGDGDGAEGKDKELANQAEVVKLSEELKTAQKQLSEMQHKLTENEVKESMKSVFLSEKDGVEVGLSDTQENREILRNLLLSIAPQKRSVVLELLGKVQKVNFSEKGLGGTPAQLEASEKLEKDIQAYQKDNPQATYSEALIAVSPSDAGEAAELL